jgi:hypothetical protein
MVRFEAIGDEYDAARPSYPQRVYEALGPLAGRLVLDVGAGTGIPTRHLKSRSRRRIASSTRNTQRLAHRGARQSAFGASKGCSRRGVPDRRSGDITIGGPESSRPRSPAEGVKPQGRFCRARRVEVDLFFDPFDVLGDVGNAQ